MRQHKPVAGILKDGGPLSGMAIGSSRSKVRCHRFAAEQDETAVARLRYRE